MGIKRIVDVQFWTDGKVNGRFTPEDKLFMLYLMTNPHTTQLGIYQISIKFMAFETGYSSETILSLLERFENKYDIIKCSYFEDGNEVEIAIKNYLKYSIVKGGAPVRDCLIKELKKVKNQKLINFVFCSIKGDELLNETVKNLIEEYEEKNGEIQYFYNKNNNENDNDVSWDESLTNRYTSLSKRFNKPTIEEIQQYCDERKNNINANSFYDFYESKGWMVGKNKMKDWKACVRTWEKNNTKNAKTVKPTPTWYDDYEDKLKETKTYNEEEQAQALQEAIASGLWG